MAKKKVCGEHELRTLSRFILRHKTHQYYITQVFFKLLRVFKKQVASKYINVTTEAVEEIKRHYAEQVNSTQL